MMLNSRFELSKIEKNTRVEREICLATLENREWKENLFLPLSKIESRKRIVSCHSRKSRVEREMGTIKFSRSREKFLFLLSIFLSRARLLSMPVPRPCEVTEWHRLLGFCLTITFCLNPAHQAVSNWNCHWNWRISRLGDHKYLPFVTNPYK